MEPVAQAFAALWPQARCMNLLDDTLSQDRQQGASADALAQRMVDLALYARAAGAQGILYTCSAFGPAIDAARAACGLPTLKPNEAMFDEAFERRPARVGLLTSFAPAAPSLQQEWAEACAERGQAIPLQSACADGAMQALQAGDRARHDALVLEAAESLRDCDFVLLGQFSLAASRGTIERSIARPVLASTDSAVRRLRAVLPPTPSTGANTP